MTKALSSELMRQADLVVVTGSQANVRAGYSSGTPALGVGAGNVAVIVDACADCADAARQDHALQDFRQRDELLVGEQPHLLDERLRPDARGARAPKAARSSRPPEKATLQAGDVSRTASSLPAMTAQSVAKICATRRTHATGARSRANA